MSAKTAAASMMLSLALTACDKSGEPAPVDPAVDCPDGADAGCAPIEVKSGSQPDEQAQTGASQGVTALPSAVKPVSHDVAAQDSATTAPDTTAPDTTAPDTTAPDTTAPDTTAPPTTEPAPTLSAVHPTSGSLFGGVHLTITGGHFREGAVVKVGGLACLSTVVASAATINCVTDHDPTPGAKDVTVALGQTATLPGAYTALDPRPTSVAISADRAMGTYRREAGLDLVPIGSGAASSGTILPAAYTTPFDTTHPATISGAGAAPTGAFAAPSGNGDPGIDPATPYTVHIGVDAAFPAVATPACNLVAPYAAVNCTPTGFDIPSSSLVGRAIQVKAFAQNGDPEAFAVSNALPVTSYTSRVVAHTSGDVATPDIDQFERVVAGGKLYFRSTNGFGAAKLYAYDDLGGTVTQITNISGNQHTSDEPLYLASIGSTVVFLARNASGHYKYYRYDGTAIKTLSTNKTESWDDLNMQVGATPHYVTYTGKLCFKAQDENLLTTKLFCYDPSDDSLHQITATAGLGANADDFDKYIDLDPHFTVAYGQLFFRAFETEGTVLRLYRYDGTTVHKASNFNVDGDNVVATAVMGGTLYYVGSTSQGANVHKLLRYNADNTITVVSNVAQDVATSDTIDGMIQYNDKLWFIAFGPNSYSKLYRYDGADVKRAADISGDPTQYDYASDYHLVGGKMIFVGLKNGSIAKLYVVSPDDSVKLATNTAHDPETTDYPFNIAVYGDNACFLAYDGVGATNARFCYNVATNTLVKTDIAYMGDGITYHDRLYVVGSTAPNDFTQKLAAICETSLGCAP